MHAERLLWSILCALSLVLIAKAVFLLGREQTDRKTNKHRQTRLNALPTPAATQPAWVTKARFGRLLRSPAWKQGGPVLKYVNDIM